MFELKKSFRFDAAHELPFHEGKCKRLHGHTYTLTLHLRSTALIEEGSSQGMVIDFYDVDQAAKPMLEQFLDHHYLNESLKLESPTAEAIARWIYRYMKPLLPLLYKVTLSETPTSIVEYYEV